MQTTVQAAAFEAQSPACCCGFFSRERAPITVGHLSSWRVLVPLTA